MNRIQTGLIHALPKAIWLAVPIVAIALILVFTAQGHGPLRRSDIVTVLPSKDLHRADTLSLRAKGLLPDTVFTVYLTEFDDARFAAADYIGELETNEEGRGSLRVGAVIDARQNLNHVVLRLSNPVADDVCFTPVTGPISLPHRIREADVTAGRTASLATIFISESRSIDDASLFHTINWRFSKCVSTF